MSTDKTLADAQPGGRVRLGDQAERARFEAFLSENPLMALCAGTAWQVWQAALSAQPSPGGQDALAVIEELAELNRACAALDPDYKGPSDAAVQAAIAALSAQPSPEGQGDADGRIDIGSDVVIDGRKAKVIGLDPYTSCLEIEWANAAGGKEYRPREQMSLASRQPVEVSEGEFRAAASRQTASAESNATAEAMIAIARQPVGEPVAVVGADFDLFWIGSGPIAPLVERNGLRPGSKLYAAPPAQAVDLGAVRALLQRRIEQWRSHLPADPGAPGTREIETKGEHDYNNDVRIYREGIAVMEEAVALIGQTVQAVDLGQFRVAVYCMQNYTGVLPRKYWDKGSKAFDAEATRLMTVVDGAGVARG